MDEFDLNINIDIFGREGDETLKWLKTYVGIYIRIDFPQLKKYRCDSSLVIDEWSATRIGI